MSDSDFIRNVNSVQNGAFSTPEIAEITDLRAKLQAAEETGAEATQMMVAAVADMFTVQEERDEWKSRAEAAEDKVARLQTIMKDWQDNEDGSNYDFQIQGLLLRQTVEERDVLSEQLERVKTLHQRAQMQLAPSASKIIDLYNVIDEIKRDRDRLQDEVARLIGITPDLPPRPPTGDGMPRYGVRWNGPNEFLAVPMDDGYWTPWHLAVQTRRTATEAALRWRWEQDERMVAYLTVEESIRCGLAALLGEKSDA